MDAWGGVRERVLALGAKPDSRKKFGAQSHEFELEPQLTAAQLSALEAWLGAELPEEYRSFLLQVGAGGAGPAHGVFPVRPDESGGWQWIGDGANMIDRALMATPFPEPVDPEALQAVLAQAPDEEEFEDIDDFDPVYEAWDEKLAALIFTPERTAGAICLCHYGCAYRAWLVVTGPERGHMWSDPRWDDADLAPMLTADGDPLTFAAWYLEWLVDAEAPKGKA